MLLGKTIALIVAASDNQVIGVNNQLPWHLPNDLKWFKQHTLGKPVVMGRKTFESIGKPLPGRQNIILSRAHTRQQSPIVSSNTSLHWARDLSSAIEQAQGEEVMIIGGDTVYQQAMKMDIVDVIYLTRVHVTMEGDAFFSPLDPRVWVRTFIEEHAADETHAAAYTFECWARSPYV